MSLHGALRHCETFRRLQIAEVVRNFLLRSLAIQVPDIDLHGANLKDCPKGLFAYRPTRQFAH